MPQTLSDADQRLGNPAGHRVLGLYAAAQPSCAPALARRTVSLGRR